MADDGVTCIGDWDDIVRRVLQHPNDQEFRGANDRPLQVDGVYRLSMQGCGHQLPVGTGLPQTGDTDPVTLQELRLVFPRSR